MNKVHHVHGLHKLPLIIDKKKTNIKCLGWYTLALPTYTMDKVMLITDLGNYEIDLSKYSLIINEFDVELHTCVNTIDYLNERRKDW